MDDQTGIRWDNALKGLLARSWCTVARYGNLPTCEGLQHLALAAHGLFIRARALWLDRNQALHGDKEMVEAMLYTIDSAAIRYSHA